MRSSRAQRNHIGFAIHAFVRLEMHWFNTDISWYETKLSTIREAVSLPTLIYSQLRKP
ncbi:MAG TPA: hypothetical protein V6D19_09710 [Stenomitos sp.]